MTTIAAGTGDFVQEAPPAAPRFDIPVYPRFAQEVLPALALWWAVMLGLLFGYRSYFLPVALVGTPTIIMLWPVGRHLGLSYFRYRRSVFVLAIITMWFIPTTGWVMQSDWSFTTKSAIFFSLPAIIGFGGVLVALPWAQARPVGMFFRPDLIFGDGRVIVGGTLLAVLGLRYIFAPAPAGQDWALPQWNWYSLAFGIGVGIIPLVAVRGMMKLLQRHMRTRDQLFTGWPSLAVRDLLLLFTGASFGFAFHNIFRGSAVFSQSSYEINARFWMGVVMMILAGLWIVFVRGHYKRAVGEPFLKETIAQGFARSLIFVVGWVAFFYGLMSMLNAGVFGPIGPTPQLWAGAGFLTVGIAVLTVGRVVSQYYFRRAWLAQWVTAVIPGQGGSGQERMMTTVLRGLALAGTGDRRRLWAVLCRAVEEQPNGKAAAIAALVERTLNRLPEPERAALADLPPLRPARTAA